MLMIRHIRSLGRVGTLLVALAAPGIAVPLVVAAPAAADTSAQAIAFLNQQRAANGIPAGITDDPEWDAGCAAHMNYLHLNGPGSNPHSEDPSLAGYTDAGEGAAVSSVLAFGGPPGYTGIGFDDGPTPSNPWEAAPIHFMQLLAPALSVTGYAPGCMFTWPGYQRAEPATPQIFTYPGNGTSFIYPKETASEGPFTPGQFVGLPQGTTTGPYLYVLAWGVGKVHITSATLSGPSGPVEVRTVDDDTNGSLGNLGSYLPPGGMLIPVQPLAYATTYTAHVSLQDDADGAPLNYDWSFQTAPKPLAPANLSGDFEPHQVDYSSDSPAPVTVTITRLPSGTVVAQRTLGSSDRFDPHLQGGHYRACFTQPATSDYAAAEDCQNATWRTRPRLRLGRVTRRGGRLTFALNLGRALRGQPATVTVRAMARRCMTVYGGHRICGLVASGRPRKTRVLLRPHRLVVSAHGPFQVTVQTRAFALGELLYAPARAARRVTD